MFKNRTEAGMELVRHLEKYRGKEVVVLAIPRGGLPLGSIIAKNLDAPLDVAIIKKIGHPQNKEYAIGAISKEGYFLNPSGETISQTYIEEEIRRLKSFVEKRNQEYYSKTQPHELRGKWVLIVDDGIATGSTVLATVELAARQEPAGIVIATPVAPPRTLNKLRKSPYVDEVICLDSPVDFMAVGQFYENFAAVTDDEAISLLEEANRAK